MGEEASIQSILQELRSHAEHGGDDSLLDLVIEMEAKLAESNQSISVGNISNSTAVAIGNGIDIVIHQSNLPETLVARLNALVDALEKPTHKQNSIATHLAARQITVSGFACFSRRGCVGLLWTQAGNRSVDRATIQPGLPLSDGCWRVRFREIITRQSRIDSAVAQRRDPWQ